MNDLAHSRCLNHPERAAMARCPRCRHFFCRECITEHADQVICAACLKTRIDNSQPRGKISLKSLSTVLAAFAGFIFLWFLFYLLGHLLLNMPTVFHEVTMLENLQ